MTNRLSAALLLATLPFSACGGDTKSPARSAPAPSAGQAAVAAAPSAGEARALFDSLCFTCHGSSGHGDGPGAGALDPKPRSFADSAWQASVTDEHIKKVIVYGGAAVGKSPMMVAQPQLKGNDKVLDGLVQIVRGFKGK